MAKVISFGIQKGGSGKSSSTGITAYLLAKKYRILAVDFDSQGNLTQLLSLKSLQEFEGKTVLEAVQEEDPRPYIYPVTDFLHLLPADDFLSIFGREVIPKYNKGNPSEILRNTLKVVQDDYDFILCDLPPNLGDQTINGLYAADYVVVMMQAAPFCYDALHRFLEMVKFIQEREHPDIKVAGILPTMVVSRAVIDEGILVQVTQEFNDLVFNTVIKRRQRIQDFSASGITEATKEDREALAPYKAFVKELLNRV